VQEKISTTSSEIRDIEAQIEKLKQRIEEQEEKDKIPENIPKEKSISPEK
jgi:hypothetical protein